MLKYKIPHRWENAVNLGASWCTHCGYFLPPGKKISRCSECSKSSHRECFPMVPCFCGLDASMADTLIAVFEAHEQKMHQKELEEAAQAPKEQLVFGQADMTQLRAALEHATPAAVNPPSLLSKDTEILLAPPIQEPNKRVSVVAEHAKTNLKDLSGVAKSRSESISKSVNEKKISPAALRDVTLEDFHLIAVLGRGAFGKVLLASEKTTNGLYAIKALKKDFIIQNDDVKSVKLEKFIFQAASQHHHPFLVNLHSAFDTNTRIYFVMEYVSGGDLMCHIQEKKRFHQGRARFYACEVLTAIQYFHSNGIIYR